MKGFLRRAAGRIRDLTARHPVPVLLAVGLLGAGGVSAGGYYAYQTYDYVQHDNDFCMSCHLMAEPFERFARSAHRGLGCKACHQPTFAARSQMALTQIIENPDEIAVHAEVPNDACASCHIEGDPETWETIRNSAGHRVHLESDDASLEGLQCVQCHSSGVHEFAATDQTCGQSGCHTDVDIQLGRMGDFTIHCAACHGFSRSIPTTAEAAQAREALAPTQNECLSCHAMRVLVDMPPDEPHEQVCSTCHNPHTQTTPAQAVETCATVGCHDDVRELTPFHRGLDHADVENCSQCHTAHDWTLDGDDCLSCHQDVFDDAGVGGASAGRALPPDGSRRAVAAPVSTTARPIRSAALYLHARSDERPAGGPSFSDDPAAGVTLAPVPSARRVAGQVPGQAPGQVPPNTSGENVFRHANHRTVECTACHVSTESHGALTVTEIADCRSCHHTGAPANDCAACHEASTLADRGIYPVAQRLTFSVMDAPISRELPFDHGVHPDVTCATCHQEGLARPVDTAACATCHTEHHEVGVTCMACHAQPAESAHAIDDHVGCTGVGCHEAPPFEGVPRQRDACLVCHQDQIDHRPGEECAECHALSGLGWP